MSLSVSVHGLAAETIRFDQDVEITFLPVESPLLSSVAQNLLNRLDVRGNYTSLHVWSVSRSLIFEGRSFQPFVDYLRVGGAFSRCEGPIEQLIQSPNPSRRLNPLSGTGSIVTEEFQTFDRSRSLRSAGEGEFQSPGLERDAS